VTLFRGKFFGVFAERFRDKGAFPSVGFGPRGKPRGPPGKIFNRCWGNSPLFPPTKFGLFWGPNLNPRESGVFPFSNPWVKKWVFPGKIKGFGAGWKERLFRPGKFGPKPGVFWGRRQNLNRWVSQKKGSPGPFWDKPRGGEN